MKNKVLMSSARVIPVLAATMGLGGFTLALAGDEQPPLPLHYSGLLNDYTPRPRS